MAKTKQKLMASEVKTEAKLLADPSYTIEQIPNTTTTVTDTYLFESQSNVVSSGGRSEKTSAPILAAYMQSKLPTPPQRIIYVDAGGVDDNDPSRGKYATPFATIGYAMSTLVLGFLSSPVVIRSCAIDEFGETNLALKPNVIIDLGGSSLTVTNPITLDPIWSGQTAIGGIINGSECDFGLDLDFVASGADNAEFFLQNIISNAANTWEITGLTSGLTELHINNILALDTGFQVTITDSDVYWGDNSIGNVQYDLDQNTRLLQMSSARLYGNLIVTTHNASILNAKIDSTQIGGNYQFVQLSTSTLNLITTNFKALGSNYISCVDNTKFSWKLDGLYVVPTYANQIPTLTYLTIADGISANYPSPTNYNPASINIRGHLEGINAKLGTIPTNVVSGTWTPTFTAIAGISGTPTLFSANYIRVGSIVFYSAQLSYVATTASNVLNVSLPVASNFTAAAQANGCGSFYDITSANGHDGEVLSVTADATNDALQVSLISTVGSGTKNITITGSYIIA